MVGINAPIDKALSPMPDISICSCYSPSPQLFLGTDPSSLRDKVPGQRYVSGAGVVGRKPAGCAGRYTSMGSGAHPEADCCDTEVKGGPV